MYVSRVFIKMPRGVVALVDGKLQNSILICGNIFRIMARSWVCEFSFQALVAARRVDAFLKIKAVNKRPEEATHEAVPSVSDPRVIRSRSLSGESRRQFLLSAGVAVSVRRILVIYFLLARLI